MNARPPVVVVGAGAAGLATALAAAPAPVLLLCRSQDGTGSTSALAQGGIAAALGPDDSPQAHACDTLVAGVGQSHAAMVDWLCRQAPDTIGWLQAQGVAFDRGPDGWLQLGREGGHGVPRIVHAGGDATGAAVVHALQGQARTAAHIEWCGGLDVDALLVRDDRVCGVRAYDPGGRVHEIEASAVVLATGGIGALFARTSNPPDADGGGLALALAAGAQPRDLEFVQFHPTALDVDGYSLPLLTEALRGAGAVLQDARGAALMAGVHPLQDLAPRDIVARRVWHARERGGAWLDARRVQDVAGRFPTVVALCRAHGFDPSRERLPITPAAHFHMGGIAVDADGNTSVPGLHAVGEVACNGVHGANRLASNSLLEGIACGRRLGAHLAARPAHPLRGASRWYERGAALAPDALARLRQLLWHAAGPVRDGAGLRRALDECAQLPAECAQVRVANALLAAAMQRAACLGAHYRSDTMRKCMVGAT